MFKSSNERAGETTVISNGTFIEGKIRARGTVQVDGHIEGTLEVEGQVSVGPDGRVSGELIGENVAIGGRVQGKVTARGHLHVVKSGVIEGDVYYTSVELDRGALIDGRTYHASTLKDKEKGEKIDEVEVTSDDGILTPKSPKNLTVVS
jgi:cytoskeletal protein CcmA (bactofilin family)